MNGFPCEWESVHVSSDIYDQQRRLWSEIGRLQDDNTRNRICRIHRSSLDSVRKFQFDCAEREEWFSRVTSVACIVYHSFYQNPIGFSWSTTHFSLLCQLLWNQMKRHWTIWIFSDLFWKLKQIGDSVKNNIRAALYSREKLTNVQIDQDYRKQWKHYAQSHGCGVCLSLNKRGLVFRKHDGIIYL